MLIAHWSECWLILMLNLNAQCSLFMNVVAHWTDNVWLIGRVCAGSLLDLCNEVCSLPLVGDVLAYCWEYAGSLDGEVVAHWPEIWWLIFLEISYRLDGDSNARWWRLLLSRDPFAHWSRCGGSFVEMEWLIIRHQSWAHATFCHRYTEMPKICPHITPEQCVKTVPT